MKLVTGVVLNFLCGNNQPADLDLSIDVGNRYVDLERFVS
ncbi:hypothetical protein ANK1_3934 [plant metagenome]|uniref:Uncharacterized protein n=1 Tax=plant metagenome TaxID=1297885 RepID=A0A484Q0Q0_9ZZZZ